MLKSLDTSFSHLV